MSDVTAGVEGDRLRERLVDLVRYPSFDGYEENVVHRIGEYLQEIGGGGASVVPHADH